MSYRSSMQRVAARLSSLVRRPHAWLLIVALLAVLPDAAYAACGTMSVPDGFTTPSTSPMASGGSIVIDASRCDAFGLNPYPGPGTTSASHGTVSVDAAAGKITYTNNGDGAGSDSFVVVDASANPFTVNVTIGLASSPITVSPASLPTPNVGVAYSQTLSASGGTAPYSYVLTSGALAPGLSLGGNTISGTPNQAGSYAATLTVTDGASISTTKSYSVTVPNPSSGITVAAPTTAYLNASYSYVLNANTSGALAPYSYALNSGSLPAGLSLSGGVISGTPTATGTSNFALVVTDSSPNLSGTSPGPYFRVVNLSITVQNVPPTVSAASATVAYGSTSNPITLNITGAPATSVAIGTAPTHGTATASGTSITYTPSAGYGGPDSFTYTASNGAGTSAPATVTIAVLSPAIGIAPVTVPSATIGTAYAQALSASGGLAPYSYSVTAGALPAGLTLSSSGNLSGTPTAAGNFNFTVTAVDSSTGTGPFTGSRAYALTVAAPTMTVSPASLAAGTLNSAYSASISASGGTSPYTFALTSGALPAGLTLTSAGVLSGTPTAPGSFNFTVTATDSSTGTGPFTASRAYTLVINGPTITISPATLSNGAIATAYAPTTFSASGGTAPYAFAVTAGALPAGLSLSATGDLSGVPTAAGTFNVTITATDSSTGTGAPFSGSRAYSLVINGATVTVSPATLANGTIGNAYTPTTLSAAGGTAPYAFAITSGALPAGLSLNASGSLGGTPTVSGTFNFTITATDSSTGTGAPFAGSRAYTLVVDAVTITLSPASVPDATVGSAYAPITLTASGGSAPYGFAVTAGALPTGVSLASDGTLSGTPTSAGTFNFTVTATEAFGSTGSQSYSLTVAAVVPDAPGITGASAGDGQAQVTVSAPLADGGSPITGYTATANPGGATGTLAGAAGGTITVTGLTNGTAYTFTVTASNSAGTSAASAPSASVTPKGAQTITFNNPGTQNFGTSPTLTATASSGLTVTFSSSTTGVCTVTSGGTLTFVSSGTCSIDADQAGNTAYLAASTVSQSFTVAAVVPGAPTSAAATAGDASASVSFVAPASTGGAAITGYTVTSNPGGITATGAGSGITVSGLTNGTAYTFTVTASNSAGTGSASAASNSVTPTGSQTITFNNPGAQNFGTNPTLTATASSGLTVTFASATTAVCTITSGGALTLLAPGTCTINANQAGNAAYAAAAQVTQSFAIVVPGGAVGISTTSLPQGTGGVAYNQSITAAGGALPYAFAVTAGALPPGVSLSGAGVLSGTPTAAGTFNFTVQVTDAATQTASQSLALVIAAPTITVSPASLPNGVAGTAYAQVISAAGGTGPYTFALTSGALPAAMALASDGTLSGTPTVSGAFNITVTATDAFGFTGAQAYTLNVSAPTITLTPATLPGATVAVAYSQVLTANGGTAPYAVALTAGALPTGLSLATDGTLSGTPTAGGSFNISLTATDALGFTGTQAYVLTVAAPGIALQPATLPGATAGSAYTQAITATGGVAPYSFALTAGALPGGLTLASDGTLSGTPTASGSFNLSITATDSSTGGGPYSTTQAYTLVVTAAPPLVKPDKATTLSGVAVAIAVTANDSGRIDSIAVAGEPRHGTATVDGLLVNYTPVANFAGTDRFTYVATGPGGTSSPATVTVTVHPMPVAKSQSVDAMSAVPVTVDLTAGATGGPFTAATLVALEPANAGTATIAQEGGTWVMHFTSDARFSGDAKARFTLDNAYATSAEAIITFKVKARPDPGQDAQVRGLLDAQVESARRFAQAQLGNFHQRLEQLHGAGQRARFSSSLTFAEHPCAQATDHAEYQACSDRRALAQVQARNDGFGGPSDAEAMQDNAPPATDGAAAPTSGAWVGGMLRSGSFDGRGGSGIGFESDGISAGVDTDLSPAFTLGAGLGYGRDDNTIDGGSRLKGSARAFVGYASYHPWTHLFVDGTLGFQQLDYDSTRQLTGVDGVVRGRRDGDQWFGSLSGGADLAHGALQVTPYARVDVARGSLDAFTETGHPYLALHYDAMDLDSTTGNLGLRLEFRNRMTWGWLSPQLRVEYQREFADAQAALVRYADLVNGPFYTLSPAGFDRNRFMLGLGATFDSNGGWSTHLEYQTQTGGQRDEGVQLNVQKAF
jgi:uncharacterized protein YhjY with autotransporter beta-barrel domain